METSLKFFRHRYDRPDSLFALGGFLIGMCGIALLLSPVFPLGSVNFVFFTMLSFSLALYRPSWAFLFLVATLPFETVTIAPEGLGLSLRPYQWLFLTLVFALGVRVLSKRTRWPLFHCTPLDGWLALIPLGAWLSGLVSGGEGIRLAVIVSSFYALYLLGRVFLKTVGDVRMTALVLFASGFAALLFGIVQNIAFEQGKWLAVVMPGRPNGTFAEPDWLGFFAVSLLIGTFVALDRSLKKSLIDGAAFPLSRALARVLLLVPILVTLILTVSRSAWLAAIIALIVWIFGVLLIRDREEWRNLFQSVQLLVIAGVLALLIVVDIPLTRFDLLNRAQSTATGFQKITIACQTPTVVPERIAELDELRAYGCQHIDLEDRTERAAAGFSIQTTERPDPNVVIRSEIYRKTWGEIRAHPVFGIGWGNIGTVLGRDENGAAYNASNIWLEIILGAGLVGLLGLIGALGYISYQGVGLWRQKSEALSVSGLFILALLAAFFVFNLFNAGLLIGFVWIAFAATAPFFAAEHQTKETV